MQAAVRAPASAAAVRNTGGTACLLIADEHGNAVSVVQSVFNVFGAVLLDPQTGILFNNRMQGFTHKPGHPNSVAPGKRPAHTLCPVLVRRDGRVRYALATPGGISQTLTNVQVINHLIDGGARRRRRRRCAALVQHQDRRFPDRGRRTRSLSSQRSPPWATARARRTTPISTAPPRRSNCCHLACSRAPATATAKRRRSDTDRRRSGFKPRHSLAEVIAFARVTRSAGVA